ncbi:MAG: ornithine carbamoyltransferase, partial [Methanoregulaceae archaeon]|nr:ornithine carbamoyltransferase [Methanoregulaceae archaeon]
MKRDLISILDLTGGELSALIEDAIRLKMLRREGRPHQFLFGRSLAMVFEKSSTRTRVSFETGMAELGGHALFLNPQDLQIGRGEEVRDTARVLSRYVSAVMIRAYRHESIEEFARHAEVPVINGLSDKEHPCQIIADLMTIWEHLGHTDGIRLAWIGDGNNVCNSLVLASALGGYEITVASPDGYQPRADIVERARKAGGKVTLVRHPDEAVRDADVVATDTWVSMGEEADRENRLKSFQGYTITGSLMKKASPEALFMHCLPAHRGREVADEVIEGRQS